MTLERQDPAVYAAIQAEILRQQDDLELIASENYVSRAVLEALGSPLTNKYAEGLPKHRYYGGCEHVDVVENLARRRARELFMVEGHDIGVNVQPHAGAQANSAVYLAFLEPGDTIMGLDLSHGGHLTHGSPVNASGKLYRAVHYQVGEDGRIDMDQVRERALAERPKLIVTGASAYPRTIDFAAFRTIADEVGALLMADIAHIAGLVATGHHPSPFPHCQVVTTTTHKTLRGPRGGMIMALRPHMRAVNSAVFPGSQGGPLMHCIAAKAVAFAEAQQPEFALYCGQVIENATVMAEALMDRGLALVSDGTDNHLMLIDLAKSTGLPDDLTGKSAEHLLGEAGITVNKNTVPGEKRSPMVTSGVRVGTPAMTTRGMGLAESRAVGGLIADVLSAPDDGALHAKVRAQVSEMCGRFPVYPAG